jgi:hypothetical protein
MEEYKKFNIEKFTEKNKPIYAQWKWSFKTKPGKEAEVWTSDVPLEVSDVCKHWKCFNDDVNDKKREFESDLKKSNSVNSVFQWNRMNVHSRRESSEWETMNVARIWLGLSAHVRDPGPTMRCLGRPVSSRQQDRFRVYKGIGRTR